MNELTELRTETRMLRQQLDTLRRQVADLEQKRAGKLRLAIKGVQLGKTDEAITKGSVGTVSRYIGSDITEDDSGQNVECKNRFADVDTGKWVAFVKIDGFHYLIAAECE